MVCGDFVLPDLPSELMAAVAEQMKVGSDELGGPGDATELVLRMDNKEDAIDMARKMNGKVYRLGPVVWEPGKEKAG